MESCLDAPTSTLKLATSRFDDVLLTAANDVARRRSAATNGLSCRRDEEAHRQAPTSNAWTRRRSTAARSRSTNERLISRLRTRRTVRQVSDNEASGRVARRPPTLIESGNLRLRSRLRSHSIVESPKDRGATPSPHRRQARLAHQSRLKQPFANRRSSCVTVIVMHWFADSAGRLKRDWNIGCRGLVGSAWQMNVQPRTLRHGDPNTATAALTAAFPSGGVPRWADRKRGMSGKSSRQCSGYVTSTAARHVWRADGDASRCETLYRRRTQLAISATPA